MRIRTLELTKERLALVRAVDEAKDGALKTQTELNATATRLRHIEVLHLVQDLYKSVNLSSPPSGLHVQIRQLW